MSAAEVRQVPPAHVARNHGWPSNREHLWGRWFTRSRTEEYRKCVSPECDAVQYRKVASA